mgnify:CR=1 FL=1
MWRLDGERSLDSNLVPRVRAGVRLSNRDASSSEINTINDIWNAAGTGPVGGALPGLASQIGVIPYNDLLKREGGGTWPTQWLSIANLDWLRDPQTVRSKVSVFVDLLKKTDEVRQQAELAWDHRARVPWSPLIASTLL